jgi:hypothetical protein
MASERRGHTGGNNCIVTSRYELPGFFFRLWREPSVELVRLLTRGNPTLLLLSLAVQDELGNVPIIYTMACEFAAAVDELRPLLLAACRHADVIERRRLLAALQDEARARQADIRTSSTSYEV